MKETRANIFRNIYYQPYDDTTRLKLYSSSKASLQLIQRMSLLKRLKVHDGCVNSICWNTTGNVILSGSDDQRLVLTNPYNYQVLTDYKTSHRANIFSAKFLPNSDDQRIVSCGGDGTIVYTDLMLSEACYKQFRCHNGTTYEIATVPDEPHRFLSCGEDGTVRWFDLRAKDKCSASKCRENVLISCQRAVTALSVNPVSPYQLAIGCSDSTVRIFDRRALGTPASGWADTTDATRPVCSFTVPEFEGNPYRITSLSYSPDGQDVLVSYSGDHLYLFSMKDQGSMHLRKGITIGKGKGKRHPLKPLPPPRRLRIRGDWSDTGPDARPEIEAGHRNGTEIGQARPSLHETLMQRIVDLLATTLHMRNSLAALSHGGEESLEPVAEHQENPRNNNPTPLGDMGSSEILPEERTSGFDDKQSAETSELEITGRVQEATAMEPQHMDETGQCQTEQEQYSTSPGRQATSAMQEASANQSSKNSTLLEKDQRDLGGEFNQPSCSRFVNQASDVQEERRSDGTSGTSVETEREGNMMENLQDRLITMRDDFLERRSMWKHLRRNLGVLLHGSEPAVSLTYSDKGSTSATISLGVADEMTRDRYHAGPSGIGSTSNRNVESNKIRNGRHQRYNDVQEQTDEGALSDSEDEDQVPPSRRLENMENTVKTGMEAIIANAWSRQGPNTFDETWLTELYVKQKYMGHRNARTMMKEANFWGNDFIMSGSDCGHVFVWERETAKLCMLLEADQHVVNCLQPHPYLPMLATSGIDFDVKLWAPTNEESSFDEKFAEDLKKRNAVMLEETKDTITLPTVTMIRILACLNEIRRGRGRNRRRNDDESGEL